jgi:hypothetical protein
MMRSTAAAVRLRGHSVPKSFLASSIATSMGQRLAYYSMTCAIVASRSVVMKAMPKPGLPYERGTTARCRPAGNLRWSDQ